MLVLTRLLTVRDAGASDILVFVLVGGGGLVMFGGLATGRTAVDARSGSDLLVVRTGMAGVEPEGIPGCVLVIVASFGFVAVEIDSEVVDFFRVCGTGPLPFTIRTGDGGFAVESFGVRLEVDVESLAVAGTARFDDASEVRAVEAVGAGLFGMGLEPAAMRTFHLNQKQTPRTYLQRCQIC